MKKTLRKLLVAVTALALMSSNAFAVVPEDVTGQSYEVAVSALIEKGIITGDTDGSFHPDSELTRAQACTIIVKAMNPPVDFSKTTNTNAFKDLTGYGWAAGYISYAVKTGVTNGYPDGTFRPGNPVTLNELVTMALRAADYSDEKLGGTWPSNYMTKADDLKLLDAIPAPLPDKATKWMAAEITYSLLDEIVAANIIPAKVQQVMSKVTDLASNYAKKLDGEFGDNHAALMASGQGRDFQKYDAMKEILDGFREESGAYYVYCFVDLDPKDDYFEITVDGSVEPDDWLKQYEVESQFLEAMKGIPTPAPSAWDNDVNDPVWSAFAPIHDSKGKVVAILGIDYPAPEILDFPEWNRDSDQFKGE